MTIRHAFALAAAAMALCSLPTTAWCDPAAARAAATPAGATAQPAPVPTPAAPAAAPMQAPSPGTPGTPGAPDVAAEPPGRVAADPAGRPTALGSPFQRRVSLEFRDATLRQVFEALARSSGVNFVFDKDVRGDAKVTVFLRQVTLDEAMRVMLVTQQLDRKLLNDSTVLVFPNTPAKQREHQELVTRSLYLVNIDVKQALSLVRTMAKTRDLHADERLNALVVRDTPEVVRLVEQLLATIDLPEPEVMLEVEVAEVASDRLSELGLTWPTRIQYGLPDGGATVPLGRRDEFRGIVANPAVTATLRGVDGTTNLLANPKIRARNREKARVHIGEKLPVFTTTAVPNAGTSASVSYLDVGIKLDVEPIVQLDGDVTIKLTLEVSNLLREVEGPSRSLAYQVGTRLTTTSLRLKDGQTQVLAGLINDEDRQRATGVPGLSRLPLLGRLFGVRNDTRTKTEVVLMITPRILRQITPPDARAATLPAGTDAMPGAAVLRIQPSGRAGVGATAGSGARAASTPAAAAAPEAAPAVADASPVLRVSSTAEATVGGTASVTLANGSGAAVSGELVFDAALLQPASAAGDGSGRLPFQLPARGESVVVLRVLPAAAGQTVSVSVSGLAASTPDGAPGPLPRIDGDAVIRVPANAAEGAPK